MTKKIIGTYRRLKDMFATHVIFALDSAYSDLKKDFCEKHNF